MTFTSTQYAPNITQAMGARYAQWTNIDKLKKKGGAARTNYINISIAGSETTPAPLTFSGFNLNVPNDAEVRKLIIEYKQDKLRAKQNRDTGLYEPCTDTVADKVICNKLKSCSIPAPTIRVVNTNIVAKGQAPSETTQEETLTFDFGTGKKLASLFNNFSIQWDYGANTSKKHGGYVRLYYVRVKVEYALPNYAIKAESGYPEKTVYNGDEYSLSVTCSDSNITKQSQNITIVAPSGFTFKEARGNGTVVQNQAHSFTWTPNMNAGWANAELVFEVNVGFTSSVASVDKTFNIAMQAAGLTGSHTVTVYKRTAPIGQDTDTGEQSFDYDTQSPTLPETKLVTVDEEFEYTLTIDDITWDGIIQTIYAYGIEKGWWTGTLDDNLNTILNNSFLKIGNTPYNELSLNQKLKWYDSDNNSWKSTPHYCMLIDALPDKNDIITLKGISTGYDELYMYIYGGDGSHTSSFGKILTWKFIIRPHESDLTVPDMSLLTLTDEELDRLGDGYGYVLQSYLKQVTNETYVRDWYKNLRIGVFNNRIEANCSTFYQYNNTGTNFEGYLQLPPRFSIDNDAYIIINVDKAIDLNLNDTDYSLSDNDSETIPCFGEYNMSTVFTQDTEDTVNLTMTLYDGEDTELYAVDYQINFNAETDEFKPVTIDTSDYDNLTPEQIFQGAEYWSKTPKEPNTYESIECNFTHDKNYPFYILITGDYPEGDQANNDMIFTEPCIIESSVYTERLDNGIYPVAIDDLILNDGSTAEVTLSANNQSDTIVFYDYPLDTNYGTNTSMAIRGIELVGNVEQGDEIVLYSQLKSPDGESRQRSIILNDANTTVNKENKFSIGGNGDLWGFSTLDMTNMEDWETELTISNTLNNSETSLTFGDVYLIFHVEQVDQQDAKIYIEGEDIAYYGAFVTDVKVPEGLETDTKYLDIDGTDTNDCYRQNIREKTIKIEFEIGDNCSLTEATESLRQLTKLLVNERDEYNRPIPKRLQLSHYPEVYWEYVMEKPLDADLELSSYHCKAELTVPAGTSYDLDSTTTASTGFVNGIASVNPNIIVRPTGEIITIRETVSEQEFHIGYAGGWDEKILEIDCENRIVWLKESEEDTEAENLNKYVDFNSDWFSIIGEYAFTGTNCIIRTVDYQERW